MNVLSFNSGSSSIKFKLFSMENEDCIASGRIEDIGRDSAAFVYTDSHSQLKYPHPNITRAQSLQIILDHLSENIFQAPHSKLQAIGHRVVHGGNLFNDTTEINDAVLEKLGELGRLAPLHNDASIECIRACIEHFPKIRQYAVFDTAFHHTLPSYARHYALPLNLQHKLGIQRYGFHGISHQYITEVSAAWLGRKTTDIKLISLHLGNGASACAVDKGKSMDTSMGFTPLEGLIMGTRCGDIDPAIPGFLAEHQGYSARELSELFNRQSGLQGLCHDNDMQAIVHRADKGDREAQLAFDMFCYRVRKYIGAYLAALNGVDVLAFTGGIGENSDAVRARICLNLESLGIELDMEKNQDTDGLVTEINAPSSRIKVLVIPTDEELQIARAVQSSPATDH